MPASLLGLLKYKHNNITDSFYDTIGGVSLRSFTKMHDVNYGWVTIVIVGDGADGVTCVDGFAPVFAVDNINTMILLFRLFRVGLVGLGLLRLGESMLDRDVMWYIMVVLMIMMIMLWWKVGRRCHMSSRPQLVGLPTYKHNDITVNLFGGEQGWWARSCWATSERYDDNEAFVGIGDTWALHDLQGAKWSYGFA